MNINSEVDTEAKDTVSLASALSQALDSIYQSETPVSDDDIYDRFAHACERHGITLWPHQTEAILDLLLDNHVILATPTGSGKSMVASAFLFIALSRGRTAYYTAPIKALVNEKFFDLTAAFGPQNVGMITGDTRINSDAPIICCTEEILANKALRGVVDDDACVVIDEFHYYGDRERGWAWQVPLLSLPSAQFLLMSATLGDTSGIEATLDQCTERVTSLVNDVERPVKLEYHYVSDMTCQHTLEWLIKSGQYPIYVVHFSQEAAVKTAESLANGGFTTREQREAIKKKLTGFTFSTAFGKTLRKLLSNGVGIHHAGMLPKYRRLIEQLAQEGLLPIICGTDTLGVGINVPIHTVLFTSLTKFDGVKQRKLHAREFHQIAGRAGRMGFDQTGMCVVEAPDYEIALNQAKAKGTKKPVKKKQKEGYVSWDQQTFDKLVHSAPETLLPHFAVTHSIVLSEVSQGGDAKGRLFHLIDLSRQSEKQKDRLRHRADEIFDTLERARVIDHYQTDDGEDEYTTAFEMPENFALDEPLSPFLLETVESLDDESPEYTWNVLSLVEATLENPWSILRAQQNVARAAALDEMRDLDLDYQERMDRLQRVTYPQPLKDFLEDRYAAYCQEIPWARDYELSPKSIVRDMLETSSNFNEYISRYRLDRSEGMLLHYLSDAYRVLTRTIPREDYTDELMDIVHWLALMLENIDSSLIDEWNHIYSDQTEEDREAHGKEINIPLQSQARTVRGLLVLLRNELFHRVELIALEKTEDLARVDEPYGMNRHQWDDLLDAIYEEHEEIYTDQEARSSRFFITRIVDNTVYARQILDDNDGDHDWAIDVTVTLDDWSLTTPHFTTYTVDQLDHLPVLPETETTHS